MTRRDAEGRGRDSTFVRLHRLGLALIVLMAGFCVPLGCRNAPRPAGPQDATFLSGSDLPATPSAADVVRHLESLHFSGEGLIRRSAEALEGVVPRPWTVERLAASYAASLDDRTRAATVRLLAASRSPIGLRVVGNALDDRSPSVRIAAAEGLAFFWIGELSGGGNAESLLTTAQDWWQERRKELLEPGGEMRGCLLAPGFRFGGEEEPQVSG